MSVVPRREVQRFWELETAERERVITSMRQDGAQAIVAELQAGLSQWIPSPEWKPIGPDRSLLLRELLPLHTPQP